MTLGTLFRPRFSDLDTTKINRSVKQTIFSDYNTCGSVHSGLVPWDPRCHSSAQVPFSPWAGKWSHASPPPTSQLGLYSPCEE